MRIPARLHSLSATLLCCGCVGLAAPGSRYHAAFSIREQSAEGWTIDYSPPAARFSVVTIVGEYHIEFAGAANPDAGGEGAPKLPVDVLTLGVPFGATVAVELVNASYATTRNQLVAPVASVVNVDATKRETVYRKSPTVYAQNVFLPVRQTALASIVTFRQQRIASIRVAPYQYNPATRELRRLLRATLRIRINARAARPVGNSAPDPRVEPMLRNLLLNYEQARQWRQLPPKPVPARDPSRDWFKTGKAYFRIPVAADGWYGITKDDLAAVGVSQLQVDFPTVQVFQKGIGLPVWIGPDSTIQFYALRNYGDTTYYDFTTDTSACWLTWGDTTGSRYATPPPPSGSGGTPVTSSLVTRHFEQNTDFYVGTGDQELGQNSPVPGRGWVWDYYNPGTAITHTFSLDNIDAVAFPMDTLRVRLFSTTSPSGGIDHKATFLLNDSLAGQVYFTGRAGVTSSVQVPARWLVAGPNRLTVRSDTSVGPANQFYLDWFEIVFGRTLRAQNDQLTFISPPGNGPNPVQFTATGFTTPGIRVFDVSLTRRISGAQVTGDSLNGFSVVFRDTAAAPKSYLAVSDADPLPVLPLSRKVFSGIRDNAQGADYIVITHRNFLQAATQLAAHRAAFNGVRTAVVDVQDIYDEFNYGVMNGDRIKDFLSYAYMNWPLPRPFAVLMFGGASWDPHHYLTATVKTDFLPAYGVPAGDNWFVCFSPDTTFFPSMLIGRLPVEDPGQAQDVAAKVIGYDAYTLGDWNKNFLFITGGFDSTEEMQFNYMSNNTIASYAAPPPIGGSVFTAYKFGPAVIDPGYKDYMKGLVQQGLLYMNYLGHSGGRVWSVDIGPPDELENTNGELPFVSSVSCNVGAFAEPTFECLSEEFVLADNRGAIGMWSSSALGYPFEGQTLVNNLLEEVLEDSLRDFGTLTTLARIRLWQSEVNFITLSDMNLTPLLGDPLSRLALPLKPDFAVFPSDISLNTATPTTLDTAVTLRIGLHNYGLVPPDSVVIQATDLYNGQTVPVLSNRPFLPPLHRDSIAVGWNVVDQPGKHSITVTIDPNALVDEVSKANNSATVDLFIFASSLSVIAPLNNAVVPPGTVTLTVSSPVGGDTAAYAYAFELDTVATFDSPFHLSTTAPAGPVSGQWRTAPLPINQIFFWRARTLSGTNLGRWVTSAFSTSSSAPAPPVVRWREYAKSQFARENFVQTTATDTGVTIATNPPVHLFARSLGYRADLTHDYYSIFRINQQTVFGLWWIIGNSFMTLRINQFTGAYDFRPYNVYGSAALADSMAAFINTTVPGDYFAISVIFDGFTNVNANLRQAIHSLGSAYIDSLQPGQSWVLIGRKGSSGPGMPPLEQWSPSGVAQDSIVIQNLYSFGSGTLTTTGMPMASNWQTFHWRQSGVRGVTTMRTAMLGVKSDGSLDTLRILPQDSTDVSLAFLDPISAAQTYSALKLAGLLASSDALVSPALNEWSMDFQLPADLAISRRTVGIPGLSVQKRTTVIIPVTVYNIGYRKVDSARVLVSLYDVNSIPHPLVSTMTDSIPVNGFRTVGMTIPTTSLSGRVALQVSVAPPARSADLIAQNNSVDYAFTVTGNEAVGVQVFADGTRLMDGDYVAEAPVILVHLTESPPAGQPTVELLVDNNLSSVPNVPGKLLSREKVQGSAGNDPTFTPTLAAGRHQLTVMVIQPNAQGGLDSLVHNVAVNVTDEARILSVYNYPNPFAGETYFTFILTGARPPDQVTIAIFTVAGRKIREINLPRGATQIGFNRVLWDGRDNDGDEIANGYYLYQVRATVGGKTASVIEKLAKIR